MLLVVLISVYVGFSLGLALFYFLYAWETEVWWRCVLAGLLMFFGWPVPVFRMVKEHIELWWDDQITP